MKRAIFCSPVLLLPLVPLPAAAQGAPSGGLDPGASVLQMLLGVAVVVALIIGSLYLLKKLSAPRGAAAGLLRTVAGVAVGPRERVVVVEVDNTWLVVGVAPGRVNMLHSLPKQALPERSTAPNAPAQDFGKWLRQVMERKNDAR